MMWVRPSLRLKTIFENASSTLRENSSFKEEDTNVKHDLVCKIFKLKCDSIEHGLNLSECIEDRVNDTLSIGFEIVFFFGKKMRFENFLKLDEGRRGKTSGIF